MLIDVFQSCHDTGDKAAQLCEVPIMRARAPTSTGSSLRLTEQLLLRDALFRHRVFQPHLLTILLHMSCLRMRLMQYKYSRQFWGCHVLCIRPLKTNNVVQTPNANT